MDGQWQTREHSAKLKMAYAIFVCIFKFFLLANNINKLCLETESKKPKRITGFVCFIFKHFLFLLMHKKLLNLSCNKNVANFLQTEVVFH